MTVPPYPKIPANLEAAELRGAMARACDHEQCGGGRRCLFAAFLAGFEASGEGFNGEWRRESLCGPYYDSEGGRRFIDCMRPKFEKWLNEEGK